MRFLMVVALALLAACTIERAASGRPAGVPSEMDSLARVEQDSALAAQVQAALDLYYQRLRARDWPAFRRSFWPAATITTRWTPPGERRERVAIQSVDEFVRRAADGAGRLAPQDEQLIHADVTGYGDVADVWAMYEGKVTRRGDAERTVRGIDAFHLYRDNDEWRIVSLVFTSEQPGRPLVPPHPARHGLSPAEGASKSAP